MTPAQRRAHLILHGQTLLGAWQARAKLRAEGDKLYTKASKLWAEGDRLRAEGDKLYAEGRKLWAEGGKLWQDAVAAEFGPDCTMTWADSTCTLGCGEIYKPDGETS